MDRAVPRTGSEEIELYIRTYYSLLRSTADVQIRTLEEVHANMTSSLHSAARSAQPDMPALIYASLRLPTCIADVERVILGQNAEVFQRRGVGEVTAWQPVLARARRRRSYYDGAGTLACFIASRSDIDDLLPMLTAFQIEWNKIHRRLQSAEAHAFLQSPIEHPGDLAEFARLLAIDAADLDRLRQAWGESFWPKLRAMADRLKRFRVRLLAGSLTDYQRATQQWWSVVEQAMPEITDRPVYFVSSNPHSLVNLLSGFALRQEQDLVRLLEKPEYADLLAEWRDIESRQVRARRENFLYYTLKKYLATPDGRRLSAQRAADEAQCGIRRFVSPQSFDVEIQVIELARLRENWVDPRLRTSELGALAGSRSFVVNIDYPLGMAAYHILSHVAARVGEVRGVYIMGKAATLNGVVGDIMTPAVVHDEHSQNTYLFQNCFTAQDVGEDLIFGTVLDNQKAVTVRGTFLQNLSYMDVFYREGYTDIEMEAGPYLSAVYEMYRPKRHPNNEIVNLYGLPFDLGILHYASDKPLGKGRNLGVASLSYFGMEPTYAASLAILKRIFQQEAGRLGREPMPASAAHTA
ncbi:MAG: hypothetical protein AB1449_02075 [Chloroflexota bacterium]